MNLVSHHPARQLIIISSRLIIIKWNLTFCSTAPLCDGLRAERSGEGGFGGGKEEEEDWSVGGWWRCRIKVHEHSEEPHSAGRNVITDPDWPCWFLSAPLHLSGAADQSDLASLTHTSAIQLQLPFLYPSSTFPTSFLFFWTQTFCFHFLMRLLFAKVSNRCLQWRSSSSESMLCKNISVFHLIGGTNGPAVQKIM